MTDRDCTTELVERVRDATAARRPLAITGGSTKRFLGRAALGETLEVSSHRGIVNYDPAELVITARGGTPLAVVIAELASRGQRLPFEPPAFGAAATLGGTIACGLSGPARPSSGPVRDYVLGARVLTGDGRVLRFGGEVMKNVAGYDVARAQAGAFGTLGVLLDVSLKVLPCPPSTRTLELALDLPAALATLQQLAGTALPLTASAWDRGVLRLRLEGSERTLDDVQRRIGGEALADAIGFWRSVREHTHAFFAGPGDLWRLHVPAAASGIDLPGEPLVEWHGLQRWYRLEGDAFAAAAAAGGYATHFRGAAAADAVFARPAEPLLRLHASLKKAFDPAGILNPGRMYPDF